jgi:tRNA/rRNA methyltransferase
MKPDEVPQASAARSAATSDIDPGTAALAQLRIVLVSTSHPGNVGSTARAMKTMGIADLALVTPRYADVLASPEAHALAAGADDVLAAATVHASVADAIGICSWSVALTARSRDLAPPLERLDEAARHAIAVAARGARVALVFGSERYGLSNAELQQCQVCCTIPTAPGFGSLNLAMAVQIATYECRKAALALTTRSDVARDAIELASEAEREQYFEHLERALVAIDFLNLEQSPKLMGRLRRLYARTTLERDEVNILRGICTAILKATQS